MVTVVSHFAGKLYGMRSHKYTEVAKGVKQLDAGYRLYTINHKSFHPLNVTQLSVHLNTIKKWIHLRKVEAVKTMEP